MGEKGGALGSVVLAATAASVGAETVAWAWLQLGLAVVCVAALLAARWRHERQRLLRPYLARIPSTEGGGSWRSRLAPSQFSLEHLSYAMYWAGLTASAALAAQAIASVVR